MPTILITGAGGQLGQAFKKMAQYYPNWRFICPTRQELDICDHTAVLGFFEQHQPDYCLNTAAYTAVDKAEENEEQAYKVNRDAAASLAKISHKYQCQLIHFSTDYVYKSGICRPLIETDICLPEGVYAASKLAGDRQVVQLLPNAMLIRTSWVYSSFGHNFVKTMLRLGAQRDQLSVVFDQIGTPTYAADIAKAVLNIIEQVNAGKTPLSQLAGIFHYSNEGVCSWYDFALSIFELSKITCKVRPIESKDYPTPAKRPHYSVLNKNKIKTTFNLTIPHWRDSLAVCLDELNEND